MASRMPFEIEDLPLPGGPYIRIERPEDTAGPRFEIRFSGRIRWLIAPVSWSREIWMLRIDWRATCSRYISSGTGIGLSISKRLVEHMHGTLECSSALGQGSEFRLQLPQTSAPTAAPRPASDDDTPPTALPDASGGTILCIDDNPANLKLIVRMLEPLSHTRVLWAQMPRLGIELAIAHQPDLILLDINMPDLDGYQVLEQLRQVPALQHTPVVAITANAMPSDVEHGLRAGFTDYLTKPLDSSVFLPKVSQWLP